MIKFAQATSTSTLAIDYIYFADNSYINSTQILASTKTLTEGDDTLTANQRGTNNINALGGNDTLTGGLYAYNNLNGGVGNDILKGGYYNDTLTGGSGNDTLEGGSGNDTLEGGTGNDIAKGGAGSDTYIFNLGDGQLEIEDGNGYDKLVFGEGITKEDVGLYKDELHIYLEVLETGDRVRIDKTNSTSQLDIDRVEFSDGSSYYGQTLINAETVANVDDWQTLS